MSEDFDFDVPDHCTVGVIGEPGQRLFLFYCRQGLTETTVKVEKQQVAVLAGYLGRIVKELGRPGHLPEDLDFYGTEEFEWVVGTIGVSYDEEEDRIVVVLEEIGVDDEEEERGRGRGRARAPRGAVARAGGRLRHPRHAPRRVRAPTLPPLRVTAGPGRPRLPAHQRAPAAGDLTAVSETAVKDVLTRGDMEVHGRIAGSSNATMLVTCRLGADELLAVYKPARGERPLWDFPGGLFRREVAAYVLSETLGWGLVPETVERPEGPFGPGSVQRFVHEDGTSHYFTLRDEPRWHPVLMELCAFDVVANNADRKSGHVLLAEDRLWAIDNGLCFNHARQTAHGDLGLRRPAARARGAGGPVPAGPRRAAPCPVPAARSGGGGGHLGPRGLAAQPARPARAGRRRGVAALPLAAGIDGSHRRTTSA